MSPETRRVGSSSVRVVDRSEHILSRRDIDPDALKVLYRLFRSKYSAYLVGGGVRDLLLGRKPKDFDVGTNATPQEIRRLFRNSRIIGRRFPIVHVYFRGGKTVEVATFRRNAPPSEAGVPTRDENWGTPEEDAWRRDLTINGLFYDIESFSVIDFVGGLQDLENRIIRTIGDPWERFREDPVRMIRAVRHAARTGFTIETDTHRAIRELNGLISQCAPARVLEEFIREFRGGSAASSVRLMTETGLLRVLAPPLDRYVHTLDETNGEEAATFWRSLAILDRHATGGDPLSDPISIAVPFGAVVESMLRRDGGHDGESGADVGKAVREKLLPMLEALGVPRRTTERCFHLLLAARRLRKAAAGGRVPQALMRKSYFGESWAYVGVLLEAEGWDRDRVDAVLAPPGNGRRRSRRRRRRRRRGRRADAGATTGPPGDDSPPRG